MHECPFCGTPWSRHSARCVGGVPPVDPEDARELSGRSISGYRIIGRIGEGGMGTVYLALDNIVEGRLDAVKVLNRDLVADRERMRREAVTANRVDHPNVCKIYNYVETYDPGSETALTLIAMELVRGPTLREVQEQSGGAVGLDRAARVVLEVANALQAVHGSGIIHRDIKPTNVIVTHGPDGAETVKLVDFGIAKKEEGGEGQDLTEAGFVAATVHYASPEQLKGQAELRSDIYSLGVVLFELLTGMRPFEAPNQAELYSLILDPRVPVPRLRQVRPDVRFPRALQPILDRALARDPADRYATAAEFAAAVGRLAPNLAETVVSPAAELERAAPPATVPSHRRASHGPTPGRRTHEAGASSGQLLRRLGAWWSGGSPFQKAAGGVAAVALLIALASAAGGWNPLGLFIGDAPGEHVEEENGGDGGDSLEIDPGGDGPGLAARLVVTPDSVLLSRGEGRQLEAAAFDASDRRLEDQEIRWRSSRDDVAAVDSRGWVRGRSAGSATIAAELGGLTASAEVRVRLAQSRPDASPTPPGVEAVCADPVQVVREVVTGAEDIDDSSVLRARRTSVLACWDREQSLTDAEKALVAYATGLLGYYLHDGCTADVILWYDRALQYGRSDPARSGIYRAARAACPER